MQVTLAHIDEALSATGLLTLGAFEPQPSDAVADCGEVCCLVLIGNAGPGMWRVFADSGFDENDINPLDDWSARVLGDVAGDLSQRYDVAVKALFPFDGPPHHPFQRWAKRSGTVHPSPIGPMIHATYGLWHAYRGALLISGVVELDRAEETPSPCQSCVDKPCLTGCPVGAFSSHGYDVTACLDLLEKEPGGPCLSASCLARRACPVGRAYIYEAPQARFHMAKFFAAQRQKP